MRTLAASRPRRQTAAVSLVALPTLTGAAGVALSSAQTRTDLADHPAASATGYGLGALSLVLLAAAAAHGRSRVHGSPFAGLWAVLDATARLVGQHAVGWRIAARVAIVAVALVALPEAEAQTASGRETVAEVGTGFGKSDFYGRLEDDEAARDAAGFGPNLGGTLSLAVYQRAGWAGDRLWLGGRFKVHVSLPSTTSESSEEYFFNHYYGGPSARYYVLSGQRSGPFVQADLTYGQFTAKLRDESIDRADHQFAVGPGVLGAVGYAVPVGGERRLNVSFYVQRNTGSGDVDGEGEASFGYGSLGGEVVLGF